MIKKREKKKEEERKRQEEENKNLLQTLEASFSLDGEMDYLTDELADTRAQQRAVDEELASIELHVNDLRAALHLSVDRGVRNTFISTNSSFLPFLGP